MNKGKDVAKPIDKNAKNLKLDTIPEAPEPNATPSSTPIKKGTKIETSALGTSGQAKITSI